MLNSQEINALFTLLDRIANEIQGVCWAIESLTQTIEKQTATEQTGKQDAETKKSRPE